MKLPDTMNCSEKLGRGFTLVEVLIALSVAALAAVGVFLGYQQAVDRTNVNKTVRHVQMIASELMNLDATSCRRCRNACRYQDVGSSLSNCCMPIALWW